MRKTGSLILLVSSKYLSFAHVALGDKFFLIGQCIFYCKIRMFYNNKLDDIA